MARDIDPIPFLRALVTAANDESVPDAVVRQLAQEADSRVIGMEAKKKNDPSNIVAKISYNKRDGYNVERY